MKKNFFRSLTLLATLGAVSLILAACGPAQNSPDKTANGPTVVSETFLSTDTDFKTQITKLKGAGVDAFFINPQTPPKADLLLKQLQEQGIGTAKLFGNDVVLGYREGLDKYPKLVEGMIGAETSYDEANPDLQYFVSEYKRITGEKEVPYMTYAATCYDAVNLIAEGLKKGGNDADKFKTWLYTVKDWKGTAGNLSIDKNGDPESGHKAKIIQGGKDLLYDMATKAAASVTAAVTATSTPKAASTTKPATGEAIKIGAILPLTGDGAAYGVPLQKVAQIAIDKVNKEGGIDGKKLEFIWEDGKCNGKDAASAVQKLINVDKVKIIYGGFCSSETLGIAPIAEQAHVVVLSPGSSSPDITNAGDYIFRNYPSDSSQGAILAEVAKGLGLKKIGMLTEQQDYTVGIQKAFKAAFEK